MNIVPLSSEYNDKIIHFDYLSKSHYKASYHQSNHCFSFTFTLEDFKQEKRISFFDTLVGDYLENPQSYGIWLEDTIIAYLVLNHETYNNRMRVVQLLVEKEYRHQNIGRKLMTFAIKKANEVHARALVLETQSCNVPAISFYLRLGFKFVGCDYNSYSNDDINNHEVRIELAKELSHKGEHNGKI